MSPSPPYSRYAAVYDRTGQSDFSCRLWPHVRRRLKRLGVTSGHLLELACGTGAAAVDCADDGFDVVACDLSRQMLLAGRWQHSPSLPRCQADMRALPFAPASFAAVTCFYDSLNYLLTNDDLGRACAAVGRALRPGGVFVFDVNTPAALRELWTGLCHGDTGDEVAMIWFGRWLAARQISRLEATFFVRGEDGRYDRFDETHDERGYSAAELTAALAEGGLSVHRVEDARTGERAGPLSRRLLYFAVRDGAEPR